jgi:phage terminase large subunit
VSAPEVVTANPAGLTPTSYAERPLTDQERLIETLRACHDDPALFARVILRVSLRKWQLAGCEEIRRRLAEGDRNIKVLVRAFMGAGKDFFVAAIVLWFMCTRPDSRGLTTAPTWDLVVERLWPEIAKLYGGSLIRQCDTAGKVKLLTDKLDFGGVWFAVGGASDHPENLEGHHSDTACIRVIDEAKAVEAGVFESTRGMLNAPENLDLWISTPSIEQGEFWKRDTEADPDHLVSRFVVDVDDAIADETIPQITRDGYTTWKADCARDWGEDSPAYLANVKAQYISDAQGQLFPSSWIERAMKQTFEVRVNPVLGQDVAGSTDGDENATALAFGPDDDDRWQVTQLDAWHERNTMLSKGRAYATLSEAKLKRAAIRVDVIGLGKGLADSASQDNVYQIEEYRASNKPRDPVRFANRKAEDAWHFRQRLEKEKIRLVSTTHPLAQKLRGQLIAMKYEVRQNGKIYVIDPKPSPDVADATLIACAVGSLFDLESYANEELDRKANKEEDAAIKKELEDEDAEEEAELKEWARG